MPTNETPQGRYSDEEVISRAYLVASMIGGELADAMEAWEGLFAALGAEPNWALADRAFAEATGGEYLDPEDYL